MYSQLGVGRKRVAYSFRISQIYSKSYIVIFNAVAKFGEDRSRVQEKIDSLLKHVPPPVQV